MYAIRSYYGRRQVGLGQVGQEGAHLLGAQLVGVAAAVITSYSIHYTKLYDPERFARHLAEALREILPGGEVQSVFTEQEQIGIYL